MSDPFQEWLSGYLHGTLSQEQFAALRERLKSDPAALTEFVRSVDLHGELRKILRENEGRARAMAEVQGDRRTTRRRGIRAETRPPLDWRLVLAAAGILLAALLYWTLSSPGPVPSTENKAARARGAKEEPRPGETTNWAEEAASRARAEKELAAAEEAKRRLEEERKRAKDAGKEEELKARESELAKAAEAYREKLRAAREKEPRAAEAPAPAAAPRGERVVTEPVRTGTHSAVARVERVEGGFLRTDGTKVALKGGEEILPGQTLEVSEKGMAILVYPDRTRVEAGGGTELREFRAQDGKKLQIAKGTVSAQVSKQPQDQPMIFATPHGEAKILGTTLRIIVDAGDKGSTELDVVEGRVELKRRLDGKTVEVLSGHFAVAAVGTDFAAKPGVGPAALREGLAGYWRFEEGKGTTAKDSSGSGNDGQLTSGALWTRGKSGGAVRLDGMGGCVDVGKTPTLDLAGELTIAVWVRFERLPKTWAALVANWNSEGSVVQYDLGVGADGKVSTQVQNFGSAEMHRTAPGLISVGTWHHIALTRDKSQVSRIYLGGVERPTTKTGTCPAPPTGFGRTAIGRPGKLQTEYVSGVLDEVCIYSRALSLPEIRSLAAGTTPAFK